MLQQLEIETISSIVNILDSKKMIQCTACRYCIPVCPKKIPITELLYLFETDNLNHTGRMYERLTDGKGKASECLKCGQCEQICSQHLPIRQYLSEIAGEYEKSSSSSNAKKSIKKGLEKMGLINFARKLKRSFEDRGIK